MLAERDMLKRLRDDDDSGLEKQDYNEAISKLTLSNTYKDEEYNKKLQNLEREEAQVLGLAEKVKGSQKEYQAIDWFLNDELAPVLART